MEPISIVNRLRTNPTEVFAGSYVLVECLNPVDVSTIGGRCDSSKTSLLSKGIYKITVYPNQKTGRDYYYPWIEGGSGIGTVEVPNGAEDGTLVFTQPVQGCRLRILSSSENTVFVFVHDSAGRYSTKPSEKPKLTLIHDERYRGKTVIKDETVMCYAPNRIAQTRVDALNVSDKDFFANAHTSIIAVKRGDSWVVYESTIIVQQHNADPRIVKYQGVPEESGCLAVVPLLLDRKAVPVSKGYDYIPPPPLPTQDIPPPTISPSLMPPSSVTVVVENQLAKQEVIDELSQLLVSLVKPPNGKKEVIDEFLAFKLSSYGDIDFLEHVLTQVQGLARIDQFDNTDQVIDFMSRILAVSSPKTTGTYASSEDGLSYDDIRYNLDIADEKIDFIDLTEEPHPDWQSYQNWKGNTAIVVLKQEIDGKMIYHAVALAKVANELGGYDVVIIDPLSDKSEYKDQLEALAKSINQGNNRCQGIIYTNLEDPTADVCADLSMILARQISKNLGTGASLKDVCLQQVSEIDKDMYPHEHPVVKSFARGKKDNEQDLPPAPAVPSGNRASQQDQREKQSPVEKTPPPTPQQPQAQQQLQQHSVLSIYASCVLELICGHIADSQRGKAEQTIRDALDKIISDGGQQKFLTELHKRVVPKSDPDMPVSSDVSLKVLVQHIAKVSEQISQQKMRQQQSPQQQKQEQQAQIQKQPPQSVKPEASKPPFR